MADNVGESPLLHFLKNGTLAYMKEQRRAAALLFHRSLSGFGTRRAPAQKITASLAGTPAMGGRNWAKRGCAAFTPICRPMCRFSESAV
jgi:hypothetical protein